MLQDALDISRPVVSISSMTGRTGQTGWTGGTDWTGRTGLTDWTGGTGAAARWQDYVPYGRTGRRTGHPKEREASGADAKPGSHEADADPGNPGLAVHWNPEKDGNIHDFPPAPPEVVDRFFRRLERSPEYRDAVRRTRAAVGGQEADFADVLAESLQSPPLESSDPRLLALASLFVDALEAGEDAFLMPDGEKRDGILMVEAMRAVPEYVWALMYAAWLSGTDRAPEYAEEALRELDEETCRALFPSEETVRAICHDVRFLADCLHADVARWLSWFFEELEDEAREAGHATEL